MSSPFKALKPLRQRFLNGFVQFEREGARWAVIFEDADGEKIVVCSMSVEDYKQCAISTDWPMENILEIFSSLRSPRKKKIIETLIVQCALAFVGHYLATVELDQETVAGLRAYAKQKQSPDTIDWAFAHYVLDDVDVE